MLEGFSYFARTTMVCLAKSGAEMGLAEIAEQRGDLRDR